MSLLRLAPWIVHIVNSQEVEISTSATLITPQSLLSTKTIQISLHDMRMNFFLQLQLKPKKLIMILAKLSCRQWPMVCVLCCIHNFIKLITRTADRQKQRERRSHLTNEQRDRKTKTETFTIK